MTAKNSIATEIVLLVDSNQIATATKLILDLESRLAKAEKVVEAARNSFYEWGDSTSENEQRVKRLAAALREYDAQGGGENKK